MGSHKSEVEILFDGARSSNESTRVQYIRKILSDDKHKKDAYMLLVSPQKSIQRGKNTTLLSVNSPLHLVTYNKQGQKITTHENLDLMINILEYLTPEERIKALDADQLPGIDSIFSLIKGHRLQVKEVVPRLIPLLTPETSIEHFVVNHINHDESLSALKLILEKNGHKNGFKALLNALFSQEFKDPENYKALLEKIKNDKDLIKAAQEHLDINFFIDLLQTPVTRGMSELDAHFFKIVAEHYIDNKKSLEHDYRYESPFHALLRQDQTDSAINLVKNAGMLDLSAHSTSIQETPFLIYVEIMAKKLKNAETMRTIFNEMETTPLACLHRLIPREGDLPTFFTLCPIRNRCLIMNALDLEANDFKQLDAYRQASLLKAILPLVNHKPSSENNTPIPYDKIWSLICTMKPEAIESLLKRKEISKKYIEHMLTWRANTKEPPADKNAFDHFNKVLIEPIKTPFSILTKASPKLFPATTTLKSYIEQRMIKSGKEANLLKAIAIYTAIDNTVTQGNQVDMQAFKDALSKNTGAGFRVTSAAMFESIEGKFRRDEAIKNPLQERGHSH